MCRSSMVIVCDAFNMGVRIDQAGKNSFAMKVDYSSLRSNELSDRSVIADRDDAAVLQRNRLRDGVVLGYGDDLSTQQNDICCSIGESRIRTRVSHRSKCECGHNGKSDCVCNHERCMV